MRDSPIRIMLQRSGELGRLVHCRSEHTQPIERRRRRAPLHDGGLGHFFNACVNVNHGHTRLFSTLLDVILPIATRVNVW